MIINVNKDTHEVIFPETSEEKIFFDLQVPKISQWQVDHKHPEDLCSPVSLASVLQFHGKKVSPISLASEVVSDNIHGVWSLNIAQAAHALGEKWNCYVTRFSRFDQILDCLSRNLPVVVSIQGPIVGSVYPYKSGHVLVVRGYDSLTQKVLCMDPGFHERDQTYVSYALYDFMVAWGSRRKGLAYVLESM